MALGHRTASENLAFRMGATPGPWAAVATEYGNWVKLQGVGRRATLVVLNGELDADMKIEVFEATDDAGADAAELTGVTTGETFANGTDEGRIGIIEVLEGDLSDGFKYVAALPTPGASDTFAAVWIISDLYEYPAVNGTAEGVAFIANSW